VRSHPFICFDLNHSLLGFLLESMRGAKGERRAHLFMEFFAHEERRTQAMEMRSVA
jgi:hypothetical protein